MRSIATWRLDCANVNFPSHSHTRTVVQDRRGMALFWGLGELAMDNPGQAQTRRAVSAAVIGNVLEWYDFAVYGSSQP